MAKPHTVADLLYHIDQLLYKNKINLQTPLIYSSDDEGNGYQCPVYTPSTIKVAIEPSYWRRYYSDDIVEDQEWPTLSTKKEWRETFELGWLMRQRLACRLRVFW